MVQVDVFWSYGLASGLTLAAGRQVQEERTPFANRYFAAIVVWIAALFAPSGMYLLWVFPSWETMFVASSHDSLPGWLVALFAATNVTQGILGYYVTWRCLRAGRRGAAWAQTIWSHAAMYFILIYGWDGTGFSRFTYTGTAAEFAAGIARPWQDFIGSPVFMTLLGMGVILVPTYVALCVRWKREAAMVAGGKSRS
jgi:hypothetical protein